uniref:Uncharacterized protein n=1 Tax=Alexandrium andersonii TaxID=327968 RepID=A0A7S2BHK9_9DINO|mmetsp:Transcript_25926/g.58892  ORF Transcript_25926/g.58892 Transcript_25926/m.58892 type:complete len:108 (+) Transcript_25926:112-435(+)
MSEDQPDVSSQLLVMKMVNSEHLTPVTVDYNGKDETVMVHPEHGPVINRSDGGTEFLRHYLGRTIQSPGRMSCPKLNKNWNDLTVTESEVLVCLAAKMNAKLRERFS